MVKLNEYQTPIEDLNLHLCPEEVQEQFMEYLTSVPFIRNLTSPDRPRCKDLPRDEQGRAIIDITNPPILEDMDYFRPTALHWERDGTLTSLRPNPNPNSEFGKWMKREVDRIWNGMVRPSDGMWITGDDYFYLNYSLIELSEEVEGTDIADRIIAMPKVWEGVWWRHLYWYSARQKALNAAEIAKRGASKAHPYCQEVITPDGVKLWGDIKVGDILFGDDGKPTKVIDIPFDGEADIYELTLRDGRKILASDEHLWRLKVHNFKEEQVWNTKKIIENYARKRKKNDRNPNGIEYICGIPANKEINFPHKETKVDPYTFGLLLGDGCFRHQSCYFTQAEEDIKIEKSYIPYEIIKWNNYLQHRICIPNWLDIIKSYGLYNKKSEYKFIPEEYKFNSKKVRLSILKGLMDSDGYLGKHDVYTISTVSKELAEDIRWICWSLGYNTTCTKQKAGYKKNGEYKECLPTYIISIYTCDAIANLPRKIRKTKFSCNYAKNRAVQSRIINIEYKGKMPAKCVTIDNKSHCYLIGDFVVTHNSYSVASKLAKIFILGENFKSCKGINGMVVAYAKEYLTKDGTLNKFEFMIDALQELAPWWPNKTLQRSLSDMNWQMGYIDSVTGGKRGTKNLILGVAVKDDPDKPRGKRSVFIGAEEFGAFPKILDTYNVMLPSVREGKKAFGMMALIGTGGSEGSDFSGALEMIYKPKGYHILGLPNVWDKVNKGIGESIFFFPAYVNRAGCYDRNGNSDVTKALLEILMDWYNAKYNTSDPMQVVRTKAENPITIQDAIMRRDNTVFPVSDLIERIGELDANPNEFDDAYVGEMCLKSDGTSYFKPSRGKPLREFPHKGNKHEGAVEIFKMPEKNRDGRVFAGRYIAGLDPIDNDLARSTTSLISCFILDLWTDQIVAEWTGRLDMADDGYEVCRRLAMFYNAKICYENNKKGLYSYFKTMNSLYLLAPNLEFLKDKDKVKGENYGNTAYGVNAGTFVNDFARERLNNWFRKPVKRIVIQDGNEVEVTRMNLYYCRNRALLQEASQWNPDGNFDRVSACGMLMLYREECLIKCGGNPMETEKKKQSESQGEKDDYFDRNWHGKK